MKLKPLALIISSLAVSSLAIASDVVSQNPVEAALQVEGAQVTLTVKDAANSFTPKFVESARENFNNFHWQMGGDHSVYYNMHMGEFLPTALAAPNTHYKPLVKNIDPRLAKLTVETAAKGELTMEQYLADEQFRTQGFMLIHKGEIVYEAYPGMSPTDTHVWASAAKTTVGAVVAMLVEEGKVDPEKSITHYVSELKGTNWDDITVHQVLNMSTALDNEETLASILNPDSDVVRFFAASFNSPRAKTGEMETWMEVAQGAQKLEGEQAGDHFRYASINTMVLTKLVENIENRTWTEVFEDRVWSKVNARQPMQFNLTPDGMAIAVGLVSTTVEDMARWGTLFTPSWKAVAEEPVISQAVIDRIRNSGDPKAFVGVMFSNNPYHSGFGENKGPALMRSAAKLLADK